MVHDRKKRKREAAAAEFERALHAVATLDVGPVLILGDGNFSFSLTFAQAFKRAQVWCTSLDTYQEVVDKYKESKITLDKLHKLRPGQVHVCHGVDGTAIATTLNCDDAPERFHHIIFNHPHTGWEDLNRHRALLAHFFHSCRDKLVVGGLVHLTLAAEQPETWAMDQISLHQGYHQVGACNFQRLVQSLQGTGVDLKRHHNSRSFRGRVNISTTFSFAHGVQTLPVPWLELKLDEVPEEEDDKDKPPQQAKEELSFPCPHCDKTFKHERALTNHKIDAHPSTSSAEGGVKQVEKSPTYPCEECQRDFKNQEALEQHKQAKHGRDREVKPDWYSKGGGDEHARMFQGKDAAVFEALDPRPPDYIQCPVCMYYSPKDVDHIGDLKPPPMPSLRCKGCRKTFIDQRGLRQHTNFCRSSFSAPSKQGGLPQPLASKSESIRGEEGGPTAAPT